MSTYWTHAISLAYRSAWPRRTPPFDRTKAAAPPHARGRVFGNWLVIGHLQLQCRTGLRCRKTGMHGAGASGVAQCGGIAALQLADSRLPGSPSLPLPPLRIAQNCPNSFSLSKQEWLLCLGYAHCLKGENTPAAKLPPCCQLPGARHPVTIGGDKPTFQYWSGKPATTAVSEWATKEDLRNCSASCLSDFPARRRLPRCVRRPRKPSAWSLSAGLFCDQYTPSGLFLPCHQGARCGHFDEMSDGLRLRHIHGVAAFDLDDR